MSASKKKKKPSLPRRTWTRSPVQKPHSTAKGGKGYDRRKVKREFREETDDVK